MTAEDGTLPRFTEVVRAVGEPAPLGTLTLRFADRRRSRLRARLDDGREVALFLPRGTLLRDGDRLRSDGGDLTIAVRAADETLSFAEAADRLLLARAAYHLGNRHVPVQIGAGWLAYEHDHVLDGMVVELGLPVTTRQAPFEPEAGGYRQGEGGRAPAPGHAQAHSHSRGHRHHEH
jgi:urease accessory protein